MTDESLLRSVVNALDGPLCIVGRGGTVLGTNALWDAAATAAGASPSQAGPGAGIADVLAPLAPGEVSRLMPIITEVIERGVRNQSAKFSLDSGGRTLWFVMRVHPITDHQDARAAVSIVDITEGMRTQQELRRITAEASALAEALEREKQLLANVLATIPHLVYWKDGHLRYTGANEAFRRARGVPDVVGRTDAELGDGGALMEAMTDAERRVLASGEPVTDLRVTLPGGTAAGGTPAGEAAGEERDGERTLLLSVLPQAGVDRGVIGVAADVTHVTALERQVAEANRLEAVGRLAAGVAHEINTPVQFLSDNARFLAESVDELLTALEGVARVVATPGDHVDPGERLRVAGDHLTGVDLDYLGREIPAALADSLSGLDRVARIVTAMKYFSHPGQSRASIDVNRMMENAATLCRPQCNVVADLKLELDPAAGGITGDEHNLTQALLNIIVNAAQAIGDPPGGAAPARGRITVASEDLGDAVRITITDDGPGMDEATRKRVFDPFFTTKPVGTGTGQGLSLVYTTVVQEHGGSVTVQSTPGAGACFELVLPREPPE